MGIDNDTINEELSLAEATGSSSSVDPYFQLPPVQSSLSENSQMSIRWIKNVWSRWVQACYKKDPEFFGTSLDNVLFKMPWLTENYLSAYFLEVRKNSGEEYPPKTLAAMLNIMQMMVVDNGGKINLIKDPEFLNVRKHLDSRMKFLTKSGQQPEKRQAAVITEEMEQELWSKQILGDDDPTKLLRTVFFLIGKHFALRSREEHRNLKAFQNIKLVGMGRDEKVVYLEDFAKNNQGGLRHAKHSPKTGFIFPTGEKLSCSFNKEICIVNPSKCKPILLPSSK